MDQLANSSSPRVAVLAGGVGAARFLQGLVQVVDPAQITAIVNTGDDLDVYGVHVSPDIDIVMYTLAGLADEAKGWGIRDDTFACIDFLALPETHDGRTGDAALPKRQRIVRRDQAGAVCRHGSNVVKRIGLEKLPNHRRKQRPKVVRPRVSHPQEPQSRAESSTLARRTGSCTRTRFRIAASTRSKRTSGSACPSTACGRPRNSSISQR